jgi:hypothetical protein
LGEDVFGLFVGSKYMSNPDFMLNEDSASTQTVSSYNGQTARLAYRKDAVEVNWQRQLYWGDLTLAAALSQGKWWLELTDPAQGGRVNLGTLKDGAFSVDVAKAAIGPVEVQGRILQVGPDYQWVLARSTESAYGQSYGYKMPGRQALYPQQQVETSLSDVSQYLGMRRLTLNLSLPGTLLGMPATIRAAFLGNSWLDPQRRVADWDQSWGLVTSKDYQQIDLTLEASRQRDLFALALVNRNYLAMHREQVPDSLQAAKLNWQRAVGANNSLINTLELRRRALWDGPERDGYSYRFTSTFDGRLSSRIRLSAGVDWRQGNYDFGYMSAIDGDRILATQYRYFQSDLKYQQSKALSLGTLNVNCTLGGHLWLLQTDLLNVPSGLSAIGYGKATIPWFKNALNQNISLIVVSGPKELNFPTGYCIPALDNSLRYDFGGSKTTSLTLRTTQFFGDENTAPLFVTSARFRILAGSGSFNLYYGYWDWERLWAGDIDRYLTQRIHPLTGGTWDEWNYWYVSKLWKTYRSTQYTNHFRLEYAFRF